MARLSGIQIISLVGLQGVGKSSIGDLLFTKLPYSSRIEVSNVVRAVHGERPRNELAETQKHTKHDPTWLGTAIAKRIVTEKQALCILTGVREPEVHKTLEDLGANLTVVAVESEPPIRFERVKALGKCHTFEDFYDQDHRELALGLERVIGSAQIKIESTDETTVDGLADGIITRLQVMNLRNLRSIAPPVV